MQLVLLTQKLMDLIQVTIGAQDVDIGEVWNHCDHKQPLTRCIIIAKWGGMNEGSDDIPFRRELTAQA